MNMSVVRSMLLVAAVLAGLALGAIRGDAAAGTVSVIETKGTVSISEGTTAVSPEGDSDSRMMAGASVTTGDDGEVVLDVNGDLVVVTADTVLTIERNEVVRTGIETVTDVVLDLAAGRIYGRVERAAALSSFLVKIPKGQVKIDAGESAVLFDISADGTVKLARGGAEVMLDMGETEPSVVMREIESGQMFDPVTGETTDLPDTAVRDLETMVVDQAPPPAEVATTPLPPALEKPPFFISPNLPAPAGRR